jgi:hypothetical protein
VHHHSAEGQCASLFYLQLKWNVLSRLRENVTKYWLMDIVIIFFVQRKTVK